VFALAFEGTAGGEDLLRQIGGGVRQRFRGGYHTWNIGRPGSNASVTRPDQEPAILISGELLGLDKLVFKRLEGLVINWNWTFRALYVTRWR
jgi:hypothetical protein